MAKQRVDELVSRACHILEPHNIDGEKLGKFVRGEVSQQMKPIWRPKKSSSESAAARAPMPRLSD